MSCKSGKVRMAAHDVQPQRGSHHPKANGSKPHGSSTGGHSKPSQRAPWDVTKWVDPIDARNPKLKKT